MTMIEDERFPRCNVDGCNRLFGHIGKCDDYEYGIWSICHEELFYLCYSRQEALEWMEQCREPESFYIVRRPLATWEIW